jgi:hypothetical protein
MGILFKRRITKIGYNASWPDIKVNYNILDSQARFIVTDIGRQLKFEVLPALTYSNDRVRSSLDEWQASDKAAEFGIGVKYGITSSIFADIAVNPDFSQVEIDAFQVEVNQRYALFYSEKRPFFMEGSDIFKFYTFSEGFIPIPVHTRQIVDPAWGVKLSGSVEKVSFGILSAGDEWPGQAWDGAVNPNEGKNAFFGIARGKYSLGSNNYIGILYSGREFADEYNHVFGADLALRIAKDQRIYASFLHSMSRDTYGIKSKGPHGINVNLQYNYATKPLTLAAIFEHIGMDFRMDTSFLRRWGINNYYFLGWIKFYPDPKKNPWLKMIGPGLVCQYTHDLFTGQADILLNPAIYIFTTSEGILAFNYNYIKEYWQGQAFILNQFAVEAAVRLNKWMKIGGNYSYGQRIFYQGIPAFKGKGSVGDFYLDLQPSEKFNQFFVFSHSDLSSAGKKIYDVNILYSRTTYQFNKYFFLRCMIQYDSFQKRMLTDFLASFTLIPGTVLHVGYGGLYESRKWRDGTWLYRQGDLLHFKRSFFAKVSYLWRF